MSIIRYSCYSLALAAVLSASALQATAQITITRQDFPRQAMFTDSTYSTTQAGIMSPAEGTAQTWNYASLQSQSINTIIHSDAAGKAAFPGALNYYQYDLGFQGMTIPNRVYEAIDASGWYDMGWESAYSGNSVTAITGGPNDSLNFPASAALFDGRVDFLQFPLNFKDEWTQSQEQITSFELSVQAFGLNNAPGMRKRTYSNHREVTGFGTLVIPTADGSPSAPINVLQLKVEETAVDSFYLAGVLAPQTLMTAFGLTQGMTATRTYYVFYTTGFGAPVLNVNLNSDNSVSSAYYRPQAASVASSVDVVAEAATASCFPNPATAGQVITIAAQLKASGTVRLYNIDGRSVASIEAQAGSNDQTAVRLPQQIAPGMYIYEVADHHGVAVARGALQVVR